jgi:hypothetical protein
MSFAACRLSQVKGVFHDSQIKIGPILPVFTQKDASTGKRRNLGTFSTMEQAKQHEREVQYFKRH